MTTLYLHDAARFLGLHPNTLQDRAKRGMIPGASKPGKRWVFLEDGLREYLNSISPCPSSGSAKRITSTFVLPEGGLDAVLKLPPASKRRRTTTV